MRSIISKYGIFVAVGILAIAAVLFFCRSGTPDVQEYKAFVGDRDLAFFVDEETGEESVRSTHEIPPLPGKNGKPTVVKVLKVSIDGGQTATPHYYLKYTDEAKAELDSLQSGDPVAAARRASIERVGMQIRSPASGSTWVPFDSEEALALTVRPISPDGKDAVFVCPSKR